MQLNLANAFDCSAALFFIYLLVHFRDRRRRGGLPYPPGPPSWPIIGNLLDIPHDLAWRSFTDMSKKYGNCILVDNQFAPAEPALQGDIFCLRVYSEVIIVLGSLSAIKDLLEKRGQTYSERPFFPMVEMCACSILTSQSTAMSTFFDL